MLKVYSVFPRSPPPDSPRLTGRVPRHLNLQKALLRLISIELNLVSPVITIIRIEMLLLPVYLRLRVSLLSLHIPIYFNRRKLETLPHATCPLLTK
jgi:hypothetical protein